MNNKHSQVFLETNFKLCKLISKRLLHKTVPAFFLIMSHSFFIAIIRRAVKAYFAWRQLKVDYSKNIWKEEITGTVLFAFYLAKYQWKKIIEHWNSVGAGAHKVGKVVSLWHNLDANFLDISKVWKRKIIYIKVFINNFICIIMRRRFHYCSLSALHALLQYLLKK